MKTSKTAALAVATLLLCLAANASAAIVYGNGPVNGSTSGWDIDVKKAMSNSFVSGGNYDLTRIEEAGLWVQTGEMPLTVSWSIGTTEFGKQISSGTSTLTNSFFGNYKGAFDVYESSFAINGSIGAGTYYLTLYDATATLGAVYWDQNNGPSEATHSLYGDRPSESFTIVGNEIGSVPEPATFAIWGLGVLGCAVAAYRRKRITP